MKDIVAIVLAAGEGKRMGFGRQKVLSMLYSKPMVGYVLDLAFYIGIGRIIVVKGYKSDTVDEYLQKFRKEVNRQISIETVTQKDMLGTGHAVIQTKGLLANFSGDVLVLYGDTPLLMPNTIEKLIAIHLKNKASCTLLTTSLKNPTGYGRIVRNDRGAIRKIVEEKDVTAKERKIEEINVGAYCFKSKELFKVLEKITPANRGGEYYLTDTISILAKKNLKIDSVYMDNFEEILGVNSIFDLANAQTIMRKRILNKHISNGVTIFDFDTTYICDEVQIGTDTIIYPYTIIERDVKIGKKCEIGPFARIRSGTVLEDHVEVGNFVELVRSKVGKDSKIKHQCYIGDAIIGRSVNIGAGTVTVNYNGKTKNIAEICDGAFIGSGTILIAPIKVGEKATTGAGCVVPKGKNIPSNTVVVGVPAKILSNKPSTNSVRSQRGYKNCEPKGK